MAKKVKEDAGGIICLRGVLTDEGAACQAFRSQDDGGLYTLIGGLGGFGPGDSVVVCGVPVAKSFCNQGQTLAVTSISRPHGHKDTEVRERDVELTVTRSTADNSPLCKLEGKPVSLNAKGGQWVGSFPDMAIEGPLQIFFQSGGWINQAFSLTVVVKHPTQPSKDKKAEYRRVTSKGEVTFDETLELV
jgi:hypothetical protein